MTMIEVLGICAAIALLVALWARPAGMFAIFFALTIVGAAVFVSWNEVQQARQEHAARAAFEQRFEQRNASASAVTVPTPDRPRAGS